MAHFPPVAGRMHRIYNLVGDEYAAEMLFQIAVSRSAARVAAWVTFRNKAITDAFEKQMLRAIVKTNGLSRVLEYLNKLVDEEPRCPACGSVAERAFMCRDEFHTAALAAPIPRNDGRG